jgi:two-component system alkaline phosphatase synthesis response regulator PhoP
MFVVEDDPRLIRAVTELIGSRGYLLTGVGPTPASLPGSFRFGGMRVNFRKAEIIRSGHRLPLSERESRLLQFLVVHRGTAVSRDALLEHVWGYLRPPLTRTVDVTILRLRQKIEANPRDPRFIVTVPGIGYRFSV